MSWCRSDGCQDRATVWLEYLPEHYVYSFCRDCSDWVLETDGDDNWSVVRHRDRRIR